MSDGYYSRKKKGEPTPFIGSIMTMYLNRPKRDSSKQRRKMKKEKK